MYDKASIAIKEFNKKIVPLEIREKAFIIRAASVKEPNERKSLLLQAVDLFKDNAVSKPIVWDTLNTIPHRLNV